MPELPEVETVARGLAKRLERHKLVKVETRRGDLRWPFPKGFVERLTGRRVIKVRGARNTSWPSSMTAMPCCPSRHVRAHAAQQGAAEGAGDP